MIYKNTLDQRSFAPVVLVLLIINIMILCRKNDVRLVKRLRSIFAFDYSTGKRKRFTSHHPIDTLYFFVHELYIPFAVSVEKNVGAA